MSNTLFRKPPIRAVSYHLTTKKLRTAVRIAFLSDLHGEAHGVCLAEVRKFRPDAVIFGGDTFDERVPWKGALAALTAFAKEFPTFYVPGNHEIKTGVYKALKAAAKTTGAQLLAGENALFTANGSTLLLCGVEDPLHREADHARQLDAANKAVRKEIYSLLITHRPERVREYRKTRFDLVLTGHAHGGQWRFPFLPNGFLAPDYGLFPVYTGGLYALGNVTLLVSRGLANCNTRVPRIGNDPELSLITITPEE